MGAGPASGRLDADALSWDIDRLAVGIYETAKCAGGPTIGGTQNGQHQLSVVVELQAEEVVIEELILVGFAIGGEQELFAVG